MMDNATITVEYTSRNNRKIVRNCVPEVLPELLKTMIKQRYVAIAFDTAAGNKIVGETTFEVVDGKRNWSVWVDDSIMQRAA